MNELINAKYLTVINLQRENNISFHSSLFYIEDCSRIALGDMENCLHSDERNRYISFKSNVRQLSFLLGRYCAKKAIAGGYRISDLSEINIESGVFNQPIIKHPKLSNVSVSIAHDGLSAIALAFPEEHPMGVDLEKIETDKCETVAEQLTQTEKNIIYQMDSSIENTLMILWTAKESLSKVLKTGLMVPLNIFEIDKLKWSNGFFEGTFTNFFQYKFISMILGDKVISILMPRKSNYSFNDTMKNT